MGLNTLAGRSFNDLCQYPVFPWVSPAVYAVFLRYCPTKVKVWPFAVMISVVVRRNLEFGRVLLYDVRIRWCSAKLKFWPCTWCFFYVVQRKSKLGRALMIDSVCFSGVVR